MTATLTKMKVSKTLKCQVHECGSITFSSDQYMSQDTLKLSYPQLKPEPIPWITSREFMCASLTPPRGESCASTKRFPFQRMHIINFGFSFVRCCVVLCCVFLLLYCSFQSLGGVVWILHVCHNYDECGFSHHQQH